MTEPARRPRVVAFDLIRLLIIGLVVSVHVFAIVPGTVTPVLGAFITVFHTSRELFFLLTAFVLVYNYGRRPRVRWPSFWWRRYLLVVPAYVAWSVIYFAADSPRLHPWSAVLRAFTHDLETGEARYHLYFLLVTMQVYLTFPLLRWLLRRTEGHHRAVLVAALCYQAAFTAAVQLNLQAPGPIGAWLRGPNEWLPSYLLYVIGGGLAAWHFDRLAEFTRRHTRAALLTMAAGVCAGVGTYAAQLLLGHQQPGTASAVFQPVVIVETLALAWGLLAAGLRWSDRRAPGRRLAAAGADCSFGIYLVHPLVLQGLLIAAAHAGVLTPLRHAPAAVEVVVLLGVVVPVIYAVSWVLAFVLRRTPLSLVLTGRPWLNRHWLKGSRTMPRGLHAAPGARWVRPALVAACVALLGAGLWTARTETAASASSSSSSSPSPAVQIARAVQPAAKGSVPVIQSTYSMKSGGLTRQWVQLAPGSTLPVADPIIVVLSGINATTKQEIGRDHLTSYVQAGEAELIYPVGYEKSWNAGGCCGKAAKAGVNDVAFIEALVASVDPGHGHPIDLVGYSNGGRLAYRISCTDPSLVNQIAVVKAMPQPGCEPTKPVTLLQVDSTDDKQVPYQPGDKGKESPPATVQVARLESDDGCSTKTTTQTRGILRLTTWPDCADGKRLAFAVYHGGGHSFPQASGATPSAASVIWSFFGG